MLQKKEEEGDEMDFVAYFIARGKEELIIQMDLGKRSIDLYIQIPR
jgi:hypothetical protein